MLSESHFSRTIYKILNDFKTFCEEKGKWPLTSGIVTDFSFANIHAICKSMNSCKLLDYLHTCYGMIINQKEKHNDFIGIHLCCSHFIKIIIKDVNSYYTDKNSRETVKKILAKLLIIDSFDLIKIWFSNIVIILSSNSFNYQTCCAIDTLKSTVIPDIPLIDDDELIDINPIETDRIYEASPFYVFFKKISAVIDISLEEGPINIYQNRPFLELIL